MRAAAIFVAIAAFACAPSDRAAQEIADKLEPCQPSAPLVGIAPDASAVGPAYTFSGCQWRGCWREREESTPEAPFEEVWSDWKCSPGCRLLPDASGYGVEVCCQ